MAYRVEIAAPAAADIDDAYVWLRDNYAAYAMDWYARLGDAVASLAEFPHRCSAAPEQADAAFELRQLIVGEGRQAYRVLFSILDDSGTDGLVIVLRVQYAARERLKPGRVAFPEGGESGGPGT
jgi:plasmid stabilization system protein ParE